MRVFITGGSGHIGSAVVPELLSAGHEVVGLARSDASAATLQAAGAEVQRGDLDDLDGLRAAAAAADGVIHLAFNHEWMRTGDFVAATDQDQRAIETMAGALVGTGKPFVGTGGTMMLAMGGLLDGGRAGTEADVVTQGGPRADAENALIAMAEQGVRSSVIRLPPTVHSALDLHGFVPTLIGIARETGVAGYVGDGANRWPAGHTLDAGRLYRLAVESAPGGTRLHAVGDEGVPFREIAETIGRRLGVPAVSVAPEDADAHFGFLGRFVSLDGPASSAATRALLGWEPTHPGLIADLEEEHYFAQ
jgi:nucleoside-diphosphate-sugar epimerase